MKTDYLKSIYSSLETEWIDHNRCIFESAVSSGLAVAGSIAMAIACKKAKKLPKDIDFVCCSMNDAMAFIASLQVILLRYQSHWRIYANHNNEFVPPGCITHFRFQCAMWMPVCVMVIPADKFQFWFSQGGIRVQKFQFAKDAAKKLEAVDRKDRTSDFNDPEEQPEPTDEPLQFEVRFERASNGPKPTYKHE